MTDYSKPANPVDGNKTRKVIQGPFTPTPSGSGPEDNSKTIQAVQAEKERLQQLYPIKFMQPEDPNWWAMFRERYRVTTDPMAQRANMDRMYKEELASQPAWETEPTKDKNPLANVSKEALYERQQALIMNTSRRQQKILDGNYLRSYWDRTPAAKSTDKGDVQDVKPNNVVSFYQYRPEDAAAYCGVQAAEVKDSVLGGKLVRKKVSEYQWRNQQDAREMQLIAQELQRRGVEPHGKMTDEEQQRYQQLQELPLQFSMLVHETDPNQADHPAGPADKANKKVVDAAKNNTSSPKMDTDSTEPGAPVNKDVENNGIEHTTSVVDEQGAGKAAETAARIERDHQPTPAENLEELDQRCQNYLAQNPDAIPGRKLRLRMAAQMGINARTGKPEKPFFSRMRDLKDRMVEVNDHARELKWRDKTAGEKVWTGVRKGGHIAKQLGKGIGITSLVVAFGIAGWVLTKSHKGITNMAATMNNSIINGMVNGLDPHARQLMGNMLDDGPQR